MSGKLSTEAVECSTQPLGISFHPSRDIIAAGLVDGTIELHDYSQLLGSSKSTSTVAAAAASLPNKSNNSDDNDEDDTILSSTQAHSKSCRAVLFSNTDPNLLFSCGNDSSISALLVDRACNTNSNSNDIAWKIPNAHPKKKGIHRLFQLPESSPTGPLLATGDDEGVVRLWDTRLCDGSAKPNSHHDSFKPSSCVAEWTNHNDFISALSCNDDGTTLLSTSGDCTLSIYDVRKSISSFSKYKARSTNSESDTPICIPIAQSEHQEDELLSLVVLKRGKKVVTGTQEGVLTVWKYGSWEDHCDRFPGHPQSIDALLKIDEDTVITGSSDGLLRVVQILPDKLLGVIGDHDGFPVEELKLERNKRLIGSVTHDEWIRLWDASFMNADDDNDDEDDDEGKKGDPMDAMDLMREAGKGLSSSRAKNESDDDWEDMDEDDDEEEGSDMDKESEGDDDKKMVDSDDSDEENEPIVPKFDLKTDNERFFEDL